LKASSRFLLYWGFRDCGFLLFSPATQECESGGAEAVGERGGKTS